MIQVLGSYGNRAKDKFTTAFLIKENIVIDAGNLANGLSENVTKLEHIFLTHSHFDHILDIPFVIDTEFAKREKTLKIYGLKNTINEVKKLFNDTIWPDFTKINLLNSKPAIEFIEIQIGQIIEFDDIKLKSIKANHTVDALGYKIIKDNKSVIISGDTYLHKDLIDEVNNSKNLKALLLECSFPSEFDNLAKISKHLTPRLITELIKGFIKIPKLYFYHFKAEYKLKIIEELSKFGLLKESKYILEDGYALNVFDENSMKFVETDNIYKNRLKKLINIGTALSHQKDIHILLEKILSTAIEFTDADAGSVYIKKDNKLYFDVIQNKTLNTYMGGSKSKIDWPPLELYIDGKENQNMVASLCALSQKTINIPDVYLNTNFDFSGTKKFDESTGYRSKSMLVIPLIDHKNKTIGVLQLINKTNNDFVTAFNKDDEEITMALASQAAISITKNQLIRELRDLIENFIDVIAKAVDEKSEYTGNHVQKVAVLAEIISKEINEDDTYFKDIKYSKNMLKEIKIAALLHDIGKITTDLRIMDKATKLEAVVDRINVIAERFEIIKRDMLLNGIKDFNDLEDDFEFLKRIDIGGEFMSDDKIERVDKIANKYNYLFGDKKVSVLRDDEKEMLKIKKGTLDTAERKHIERHALMTLEMLSKLPFPPEYKDIVHIAANHHEKLNGTGYPRGLSAKDLTLEDRLLAICDIFEALTSNDRPYKKTKKLSEVFKIMNFMVKDGELDEKIFKFFMEKNIWKKYRNYLLDEQIDI